MKHLIAVTPVTFTCDVCRRHLAVRVETRRLDGTEEARALDRAMHTAYWAGWYADPTGIALCPDHRHIL